MIMYRVSAGLSSLESLLLPLTGRFGQLSVLTGFSAIKAAIEVGTIWFLICSLESRLLPFFSAYLRPFSTGFSPIKLEVDTLWVLDLDQTW